MTCIVIVINWKLLFMLHWIIWPNARIWGHVTDRSSPSVSHHNHAQLVSEVLHLVDLHKRPGVIHRIQTLHHVRLVTDEQTHHDQHQSRRTQSWPLTSAESLTYHPSSRKLQHTAERDALSASAGPSAACFSPKRAKILVRVLLLHIKYKAVFQLINTAYNNQQYI